MSRSQLRCLSLIPSVSNDHPGTHFSLAWLLFAAKISWTCLNSHLYAAPLSLSWPDKWPTRSGFSSGYISLENKVTETCWDLINIHSSAWIDASYRRRKIQLLESGNLPWSRAPSTSVKRNGIKWRQSCNRKDIRERRKMGCRFLSMWKWYPGIPMCEFVSLLAEMVTWMCILPVKSCIAHPWVSLQCLEEDPKIQEHLLSKA